MIAGWRTAKVRGLGPETQPPDKAVAMIASSARGPVGSLRRMLSYVLTAWPIVSNQGRVLSMQLGVSGQSGADRLRNINRARALGNRLLAAVGQSNLQIIHASGVNSSVAKGRLSAGLLQSNC